MNNLSDMKKVTLTFIAVGVIIGTSYFLFKDVGRAPVSYQSQNEQQLNEVQGQETQPLPKLEQEVTQQNEVVYTDSGFIPSTLIITVGETVTFKNQSGGGMWVGSAMHPSHMVYGGKSLEEHCPDAENDDFDQCAASQPGESWSFTFKKAGTWGYHNHANPSHFAKITVDSSP